MAEKTKDNSEEKVKDGYANGARGSVSALVPLPTSDTLNTSRPIRMEEKGAPLIQPGPCAYDKELQKAYEMSVAAVEDDGGEKGGWKHHSRSHEIDIYFKKVSWSPVENCKGIGIVQAPPAVIAYVFNEKSMKPEWDEFFDHGTDLERVDRITCTLYTAFKAPWPVKPRDFVTINRQLTYADGSIMVFSTSVKHKDWPEQEKYVRGTLMYSVVLLIPVDGGKSTKIIYCVGSDPNGQIPKALVNMAMTKQPLCINLVRRLLVKKKPELVKEIQATLAKRLQEDNKTYGEFDPVKAAALSLRASVSK